jgi:hypothetical protein
VEMLSNFGTLDQKEIKIILNIFGYPVNYYVKIGMTNAEILLEKALEALKKGELSKDERQFLVKIKNYDSVQLLFLPPKEYHYLRNIVQNHPVY